MWTKVASAWFVGLLLSGVALVPLAFTVVATDRWHEAGGGGEISLATIFGLWLRFVLPNAFGQATDGSFWGPFLFVPTTVYAGALTLPFAGAALFWRRERNPIDPALFPRRDRSPLDPGLERRLRALAVMVVVCLLASYHFPGVRELLLVMPVVQKMLHHYLLLGVELGLALLAGAGLERWLAGEGRGLLYGALLPLTGLVLGWAAFHDDWSARGQLGNQLGATLLAIALPVLVVAGLRLPLAARRRCAPIIVALALADLAWAHAGINPALPVGELYARTPAIDFLAAKPERVAAVGTALRPNAAMVLGLYDVRGDDTLKLSRYEKVYGRGAWRRRIRPSSVRSCTGSRPGSTGSACAGSSRLRGAPSPVAGWIVAYAGSDATVFDRGATQPIVRFENGAPPPRTLSRSPGHWELAWPGAVDATTRLVIAETWDPGWRATIEGRKIAVEAVDDLWLGVRPGASAGRLVLRYLPEGFYSGLAASLVGFVLLFLGTRRLGRRLRRDRQGEADAVAAER